MMALGADQKGFRGHRTHPRRHLSGIRTSVPTSVAVFSGACRVPQPTALSPIRSYAGLLRQGRDEVHTEAPGCSGERSLSLSTKGHNVGTTLLAAAITSSERHCTPKGVRVSAEVQSDEPSIQWKGQFPLGAGATLASLLQWEASSAFSLASTLAWVN